MRTAPIKRPSCFAKYDNNWASQLGTNHCEQLPAKILLGVNCARIFPVNPSSNQTLQIDEVSIDRHLASEPSDQMLEIEFPPSLGVHLVDSNSVDDQIVKLERVFGDEITTI